MSFFDPLTQPLKLLSPRRLKGLANQRLGDLVLKELGRSRKRVAAMEASYPSAPVRELGQRLIDEKKSVAGMVGGVSGVFGIASVPADLLIMAYLEVVLLVDLATLHKVNLKSDRSRQELLDLFSYANGINPATRASPKVLGKVAGTLLEKGGLSLFGRAVPLVAVPISAYLNNRHIQSVGDEAMRHFAGFDRAREKTRKSSGS